MLCCFFFQEKINRKARYCTFLERLGGNPRWIFNKQVARQNHTIRRALVLQPPNSSGKQSTVRSPQTLLNMWPLVVTCLGAFSSRGWIWMVQVAWLAGTSWGLQNGPVRRACFWAWQGPFLDPSSIEKHIAESPQTSLAKFKNGPSSWVQF